MTKQEAYNLRTNDYVTDGPRNYRVQRSGSNKHDLWFWHCKRHSRELITRGGGKVARVYLGSRNLQPDNLKFLAGLRKIADL